MLEREPELATQQTGHSSGVIHAGVYYEPGSLKARLCVEGARLLYELLRRARDRGAAGGQADRRHRRVGAAAPSTSSSAAATANGVPGLRRLEAGEIAEIEPHARGLAALHSPNTGVVDFRAVAAALAAEVREAGGRSRPDGR